MSVANRLFQKKILRCTPKKDFCIESMSLAKLAKFEKWYAEESKNPVYNLKKELGAYCKNDVDILRQAVIKFRDIIMTATARALVNVIDPHKDNVDSDKGVDKNNGVDPFKSTTIAGAAFKIFRTTFQPQLESKGIRIAAFTKEQVYRLKEAFFGGRTEVFIKHYEVKDGEMIVYLDFKSLYPFINKNGIYPDGHPIELESPTVDMLMNRPGIGVWCVDVTCPQDIRIPVLPEKIDNKLMFTLLDKTKKTWTSMELQYAIARGYKVTKIYSALHWDKTTVGIFSSYINCFFKLKMEAEGWPANCRTDEEKEEYIDTFEEHEGIRLDKSRIGTR